jgi:hypothetical protein
VRASRVRRHQILSGVTESSTIHTSSLNQPTNPRSNNHALVLARHRAGRGGLSPRCRPSVVGTAVVGLPRGALVR